MKKYLFSVIISLSILSCGYNDLKEDRNCSTFSIISLLHTNRLAADKILNKKTIYNHLDLEIINMNLTIDSLAKDLIVECGGIHPTRGTIMYPDKRGKYSKTIFEKYKIRTLVKDKIHFLKKNSDIIKDRSNLINDIENILGLYFYFDNHLFTDSYLINNSYSQISLDLLVIENAIFMLIKDNK